MNRRNFIQKCIAGVAVGGASLLVRGEMLVEQTDSIPKKIDTKDLEKKSIEYFIADKKTCCEAITMAGCDCIGIKSDIVPDISLGLAGGVGLQGSVCGVVSGAAMVLSLAIAKKENDYKKKKMLVLAAAGRLYKEFEKEHGSTNCRTLCGLDLTTPEGKKALEESVKKDKCSKFVATAAKLLAKELQNIS